MHTQSDRVHNYLKSLHRYILPLNILCDIDNGLALFDSYWAKPSEINSNGHNIISSRMSYVTEIVIK